MNKTMMAAVLHGKENLRIEPVAVPELGPSDILVKVQVALTCGTDLKVFRRGYHARMITPPAVLGHELAGDIVAVGGEVSRFRVGQRIVAANSAPCFDCFYCRRDQTNLCEDLLFNNGAYAEYVRIPGRIVDCNTHEIPGHIGYRDAAMVEPLACVVAPIVAHPPAEGSRVLVIGAGSMGLLTVAALKALSHVDVTVLCRLQDLLR